MPPSPTLVTLMSLASFASAAGFRICDSFLPQLAQDFGRTTGTAGQVITVFAVAYGLAQFFFGPIGDRYGKFRVLTYATLASAIGSVWAAWAASFDALLAARLLSGATSAGIIPLAMAWIGDNVAYQARQATLARLLLGLVAGMAAGQVIGGGFADWLSWRWAFGFLALWFLCTGLLLQGLGRSADGAANRGQTSVGFVQAMRAVVVSAWARLVLMVVCLEGALVFGAFAFVPSYLQQRFAFSPAQAGLLSGVFALGGLMYVLWARRWVQTLGETGMAGWGGVLLGSAFLTYWLGDVWAWSLAAGLACGFGYYLLHSTLQTHATQMAPAPVRGTAVSLFASLLFVGQSLGVGLASAVVDTLGMPWLFVASMALCPLLGLAFVVALKRRVAV